MLPEAAQARKAIWDAVNPKTGKRRIDEAFPNELRESYRDNEMFIGLKSGGSYQVLGSDNYNRLVGSTPAGVVYSEWPLSKPQAEAYLMPILAENNGWEMFIYTPRGRNHGLTTLKNAQADPKAFAQVLTVNDTNIIPVEILEAQRQRYIDKYGLDHGQSFYDQEYLCSFDAANIGAILGRYIERAERQGRINDDVTFDYDGAPIEISADLGRADMATWWFWQPSYDGFAIVDYLEGNGKDAEEWCELIQKQLAGRKLGKVWLPHDARSKTFAAKQTAQEVFWGKFGVDKVEIVPLTSKADRINAARSIVDRCKFNATACKDGLEALREWSYEWDEDNLVFSTEPLHNWASHPGDGFSYGAQVMRNRVMKPPELKPKFALDRTFNEMVKARTRARLMEDA